MIRVNLLPPELRVIEKTPLPRLLTMIIGVGLSSALGFLNLYYIAVKVPNLERKLSQLEQERACKTIRAAEFDKLTAKISAFTLRANAKKKVEETRSIFWARKLDQLTDIIWRNPTIWLGSLKVSRGGATTPPKGAPKLRVDYTLRLECFSAGTDAEQITRFRRAIETDKEFMKEFQGPLGYLTYTQVEFPGTQEEVALSFPIVLEVPARRDKTKP